MYECKHHGVEKCESGRPLRTQFDGMIFLPCATYRVIDLEAKQDVFKTPDELITTLGKAKWDRVSPKLHIDGFYESGRYRIEVA